VRAGGQTLTLIGAPRIFLILKSLAECKKGQLELRRDAGLPAQSTLRGHLSALEDVGVICKQRRDSYPGALEYELTEPGRELLEVAKSVERWLAEAPETPLELGGDPARAAIKGLVEGWCATILTTLASGPLSLTELDKQITTVSYPTIGRCLETMRLAGQLDMGTRSNKGTPYALTDWLRQGLAPLAFAARWEHCNQPDGADSITRHDIDGALMLGSPLFELPAQLSGTCQLAVRVPDDRRQGRLLGLIEVLDGKVASGGVYPQAKPDAWASGTTDTWFSTVIDADTAGLRLSGDRDLAEAVFDGVHQALFMSARELRDASAKWTQG
jgi:DNA-binding HxlR family transcriptional regulator